MDGQLDMVLKLKVDLTNKVRKTQNANSELMEQKRQKEEELERAKAERK